MQLGRTKRANLIRRSLLNAIKAGNANIIQDATESFGLSRQAIHKHLSELVKMGFLESHGNTRSRTYTIGPVRSHSCALSLDGLMESEVYSREFSYLFTGLPKPIDDICHYGFTEMLNNAIDHSQGETTTINIDRDRESIQMMISDDGEGIFNYIARKMNLHDPRESLLELSKGKLTTDPENHSGQGIFFTSRAFDCFYIYSGDLVFTHNDELTNDYLFHNELAHKGTHVFMKIALDSNKNLKLVFDDFTGTEDENFAFNTTVVPVRLALYEGERLVSRSQAKRILNRVERFKHVVLDFQDVDFIGQAFTDEIFRVFTNRNPQINIRSINTTSDVSKRIASAKSNS